MASPPFLPAARMGKHLYLIRTEKRKYEIGKEGVYLALARLAEVGGWGLGCCMEYLNI